MWSCHRQASGCSTMRATVGGGFFWEVAPMIFSPSFECPLTSLSVTCTPNLLQ